MSLFTRVSRTLPASAYRYRPLSISSPRYDLVGPPDPVSNLRPVIYDDAPVQSAPTSHPYSLKEFAGDTREYQWKVQRQELGELNHKYWADVRRFYCMSTAVSHGMRRVTPASMRHLRLVSHHCLQTVHHMTRSSPCLTSTDPGSRKSRIGSGHTAPNGASATGTTSSLRPVSSTKSLWPVSGSAVAHSRVAREEHNV